MVKHPSAEKRHRQSLKRQVRNKAGKSKLKTLSKKVLASTKEAAGKNFNEAMSALHRAARKGLLPKKTASRKIARLAKFVKKLGA